MVRVDWRLLVSGAGPAGGNMAVDEAVMAECAAGDSPPTIRFYTWQRPAVSVGYSQEVTREIDTKIAESRGVDIVRRISGGRAVLHGRDLTYSVIAPVDLLPEGVAASYRHLADGLAAGLRRLGVAVELMDRPAAGGERRSEAPCFLAPSWWEITARGRKLVGSAQARCRGAVLQHGSIPLESDHGRFCTLLSGNEERRRRTESALARRATSLMEELGYLPEVDKVVAEVAGGLAEVLGGRLVSGALTLSEKRAARSLAADKYGHDYWNKRVSGRITQGLQRTGGEDIKRSR